MRACVWHWLTAPARLHSPSLPPATRGWLCARSLLSPGSHHTSLHEPRAGRTRSQPHRPSAPHAGQHTALQGSDAAAARSHSSQSSSSSSGCAPGGASLELAQDEVVLEEVEAAFGAHAGVGQPPQLGVGLLVVRVVKALCAGGNNEKSEMRTRNGKASCCQVSSCMPSLPDRRPLEMGAGGRRDPCAKPLHWRRLEVVQSLPPLHPKTTAAPWPQSSADWHAQQGLALPHSPATDDSQVYGSLHAGAPLPEPYSRAHVHVVWNQRPLLHPQPAHWPCA